MTTKVVKITGQGREATNFPYLNHVDEYDDDDDDDDDGDEDGRLCVCNEFGTRLKVTFGAIAIPDSRVQFQFHSSSSSAKLIIVLIIIVVNVATIILVIFMVIFIFFSNIRMKMIINSS